MSVTPADALHEIHLRVGELRRRWVEDRLRLIEWLPHQAELLQDVARYRLLRTGNQLGKTLVGAAEVLFAALGEHPYRDPTLAPGTYWVLCSAWQQSLVIQNKIWELVPRDRVRPGTTCTPELGFGGRYPGLHVQHASGGWSYIEIHTSGQDRTDLASATIDGVWCDEPPKDVSLFNEIVKRTQASHGWVLITLTPVGRNVDWLQEMVGNGSVSETHTRLTPETLIPIGRDAPVRSRDKNGRAHAWDEAFVASVIRRCPVDEVEITVHGEWESRITEAFFASVWHPRLLVGAFPGRPVEARVGIDHGHRPGKQYAALVFEEPGAPWEGSYSMDEDPRMQLDAVARTPLFHVAAEYTDYQGLASPRRDAYGILDMLDRHGWSWNEVKFAGGDRVHMPGSAQQKSNRELMQEMADILGISEDMLRPAIITVKRGEGNKGGSVRQGLRYIYDAMALGRWRVHKHCVRTEEAIRRYRIRTVDDEYKDVIDGLRYSVHDLIFRWDERGVTPEVRFG